MDIDLVITAQRGDQAAFATLAGDAWGRLYQLAYRVLRDEARAEDAAQRAVVDIWRNLPGLREPARFEAWSYRLLVNACRQELRDTRRASRVTEIWAGAMEAPDSYSPVADRDLIERGFRRLSLDQRVVLVMHHYLDMPLEAVADTLGIPVGTAKSRVHRALAQMRLALHADMPRPRPARVEVPE